MSWPDRMRVLDLGQHGLVEADDPGEHALAALELPDEVLADLGLDGTRRVTRLSQLADGARLDHARDPTMRPAVLGVKPDVVTR